MDEQKLKSELEAVLEIAPGTLQANQPVRELSNWDSMKLVEIMALADNDFNVQVSGDELAQCDTVGTILALILSKSR